MANPEHLKKLEEGVERYRELNWGPTDGGSLTSCWPSGLTQRSSFFLGVCGLPLPPKLVERDLLLKGNLRARQGERS